MANIDTNRLPGTWGEDKETSAIPVMPGQRLVTVVAPFLNGPVDRPFLVSRDDYKAVLGGYNNDFTKPDYGYLCVEETLKRANTVLVCRVSEAASLNKAEFKNDMIHIRTKHPTKVYNNLKVSFLKGQYSDEVVLLIGPERYELSVDPKSDRYVGKLGNISKIYEVVEFNPNANVIEAVLTTLTLSPETSVNTGEEVTVILGFDKIPDLSKVNITVQDGLSLSEEAIISGNTVIAKYRATTTGSTIITARYSGQAEKTGNLEIQ